MIVPRHGMRQPEDFVGKTRARSLVADMSALANLTTGLVTLPSWLTITCATTGRTTQTSASTIVSGIGANAARARNVGSGTGLSLESASTNQELQGVSFAGWTADASVTLTAAQGPAPDGTTTAALLDTTAAAVNKGLYPGLGTVDAVSTYTMSTWIRTVSGSQDLKISSAFTGLPNNLRTATTTWQRLEFTEVSPHTNVWSPYYENGPVDVAIVAFYIYAAQYELGKYPKSTFPAGASAAARAADVFSMPSGLARGGYFDVDMTVAPNYTQAEQGVDHNLIYFDANNRVFIQASTQKVVLRINSVDVLSSALTWSRETGIRVRATSKTNGTRLVITGATTGDGDSGLQAAGPPIAPPASIFLVGSSTGPEESADLRRIEVRL